MLVEGVSCLLVVSEKSFDSFIQEVLLKDQMRVVGYEFEYWQEIVDVFEKFGNMVLKEYIFDF